MNRRTHILTPKEVSVLISIRDEQRIMKRVAQALNVSPPELTRLVKSLNMKGLVTVEKHGVTNTVTISDQKHASRLRRVLDEFGHMNLETIVSLSSLDVLSALAACPGSSREGMMRSADVSARTLHTTLRKLRELGIVRVRNRGSYAISERFQPLAEFVRELDDYSNHQKAKELCADSVVIWQRGREFITRSKCTGESKEFRLTAFSAFQRYGVPLFLGWQYHYHPVRDWRRTIDEVLLQSMLIKPRDVRENTAILMLWHKNDLSRNLGRLREGASKYGLRDELETVSDYFRRKEERPPPGFPKIDELEMKLRSGSL